ncbi:class I SAM-dependent methyltransferase [Tardiphaga sp. OK246]|uniref:class I SAM-dependent methyltransferase n=1 Tax=Tardiphaga sp. OK246 TaxID=1855307 RepID=UPI001595424C|nr:class I SAM-dependent methyltransferase [Tardiphaga sp. OK246]
MRRVPYRLDVARAETEQARRDLDEALREAKALRAENEFPRDQSDFEQAPLIQWMKSQGHSDLNHVHTWNESTRDDWVADRAATVAPGSRILDVGAGTGPYKNLFAHCVYKSHDFAAYEGYKGDEGTYAEIDYVSDITAIEVDDNSFDAILCTEVLEHVPRPIEALAEMARILRPRGRLFITAPLGSGLHQQPYHFYGGYTPHWYRKFLADFACDVVSIEPNHGYFAHLAQECARFAWNSEKHSQYHGEFADRASHLIGDVLAPYFYALDKKVMIPEFTIGYHVEATKR